MRKNIEYLLSSIILLLTVCSANAKEPQPKYHRSSLYSIILNHPEQQFASEIIEAFKEIPLPDKYNDHNLKLSVMKAPVLQKLSKEELEGANKDAIHRMLVKNKIGGRLVEKWFNRNRKTGEFDMNLIRERGFYDANLLDLREALQSVRGKAQLEDAGEELINHTYVLVNDIRYADKDTQRNLQGFGILLGSMAAQVFLPGSGYLLAETGVSINDLVVGFKVYVTSYLFKLEWNNDIADNFYSNLWMDKSEMDPEKKALFDRQMGSFHLKYLGCKTVFSGETSLAGVKYEQDMFRKVCTRSIDKAISELQKGFDEFKVFTPLVSTEPLVAYIGTKEGLSEASKYEVLEMSMDENGKTIYTRKGIVKPSKDKIWDNRYMAEYEDGYDSTLSGTTFEVVSGNGFYPGMLIREIN